MRTRGKSETAIGRDRCAGAGRTGEASAVGIEWLRYHTAWTTVANRRRWDAPAEPWSFVRVDPCTVSRYAVLSLRWGLGRVQGGDWDTVENTDPMAGMWMTEGLRQRFEEGRDWMDTAYYEEACERVEGDGSYRGHESGEALREHWLPEVDELYESIESKGYRPNRGVVYDSPEDAERVHDLEPMALVGRDGEVIWTEGFHRLVLARIAGVESIPVYVLQRHADWQAVRDAVADAADGELPPEAEEYAGHPDLTDVR